MASPRSGTRSPRSRGHPCRTPGSSAFPDRLAWVRRCTRSPHPALRQARAPARGILPRPSALETATAALRNASSARPCSISALMRMAKIFNIDSASAGSAHRGPSHRHQEAKRFARPVEQRIRRVTIHALGGEYRARVEFRRDALCYVAKFAADDLRTGRAGERVAEVAQQTTLQPRGERSHVSPPDVVEHRDKGDIDLEDIRELGDEHLVYPRAARPGYGEGRALQRLFAARGGPDDSASRLAGGPRGHNCARIFTGASIARLRPEISTPAPAHCSAPLALDLSMSLAASGESAPKTSRSDRK